MDLNSNSADDLKTQHRRHRRRRWYRRLWRRISNDRRLVTVILVLLVLIAAIAIGILVARGIFNVPGRRTLLEPNAPAIARDFWIPEGNVQISRSWS